MQTVITLFVLMFFALTEPWVGIWTMDPSRSIYSPGPTPRSVILTYQTVGLGVAVTNETIDAQGKSTVRTTTLKFDGKDYPYENNVNADTVSGKRIDDSSFETQWKKDGKPTLRQRISVSSYFKTLTVVQSGKDHQGKSVYNVSVYSRVNGIAKEPNR